jgi:hypothetical protein
LYGHEIADQEPLPTLAGYGYLIRCSCNELFEQEPMPDLSAEAAKSLAYEKWKLHLHDA